MTTNHASPSTAADNFALHPAGLRSEGQPPSASDLTSFEERLRAAAAAEGQQPSSEIDLETLDDATITRLLSGLDGTPEINQGGLVQETEEARPSSDRDPLAGAFAGMFDGGLPGEFFEIRIPPIITAYRRGGEMAVQDHVRSLGMPDDVVAQVLADLPMLLEQVDIPEE